MSPKLDITHIGTATAILDIDGVNLLTDPFFSPGGSSWPVTETVNLEVSDDPALRLDQLPVIDAVLLSHEDHIDNLDDLGRRLLDGRRVFTTVDGAKNLALAFTVSSPGRRSTQLLLERSSKSSAHQPSICLETNAQASSSTVRNSARLGQSS